MPDLILKDYLEKKAQAVADARKINDTAHNEKRTMTSEEEANFDKAMEDALKYKDLIEKRQKLLELDTDPKPVPRIIKEEPEAVEPEESEVRKLQLEAYRRYLKVGSNGLSEAQKRGLQIGTDDLGGYLKTPTQMAQELIKEIDNNVFVKQYANVIQLESAASLGAVSWATDFNDADWTSEVGTVTEDTAARLGSRELNPHPLSKLVKISKTLLRKSFYPIEQVVNERLGYVFGITEEKGFLTGSGSQQPLGIFTASDLGISTGQDVSTGNTATAITFNGLKEAKYSLKSGYLQGARWTFHRDAVKMLAKIQDGDGRYIWTDSIRENEPDMMFGIPVDMSEYAPNTFTTGQYVGALANWKYYWIAESMSFELQMLYELYATSNQVGVIARAEVDGMPVDENAFARVTLA